jgi:hypothetical protein
MTLTGSCLCGATRYELTEAPVWAHACHCSRCRKTSGSAFAPNLFVPIAALRFTHGEEHLREYRPPDAERFNHVFCAHCGSTMPFRNPSRGLAGVPMGTLDDEPGYALRAHIFTGSKAPWYEIPGDLPQHPEALGSAKPSGS